MRRILAVASVLAAITTCFDASGYCQKSTCREEQGETCAHDEHECISSGAGIEWPSWPVIPYHFHAAGSEHFEDARMRASVRRAFHAWTAVSCDDGRTSLRFEEGADIEDDPVPGKAAPRNFGIYFRDDSWPDKESSLAVSRVDTFDISGRIRGANIEVNTSGKKFRLAASEPGEFDLEAVMTHEVGHYLGLDHSLAPGSIMAAKYCDDEHPCTKGVEQLRALGADDEAAVCRLYPHDRPAAESTACTSAPAQRQPVWPWLAFLPVAIAIRRRRRARAS